MKSARHSKGARSQTGSAESRKSEICPRKRTAISPTEAYALIFGLFLGLAFLKFGNPIILNDEVVPPGSLLEFREAPWPPIWGAWLLVPLAVSGGVLAASARLRWPGSRWLLALPAIWFGWQFVSACGTVDSHLTALTLWQFFGCITCYLLGALVLGNGRGLQWLLIGVLAGFAFCLVRAVDQRLFEFPRESQMLIEGQRAGWTNYSAEAIQQLRRDEIIISTNGMDIANPAILAKYTKGRAFGTLVYPNALSGATLMLLPAMLALAFGATRRFRPLTRYLVILLTLFLGLGSLYWSGSKSGWLIAMGLGCVCLFRLRWSNRAKAIVIAAAAMIGLAAFGVRFHRYFSRGATSVSARFDYWSAALTNTREHPVLGSGPGTFQRPYARLKAPQSEMARLTHNDYLEQFSDSGIPGGIAYAGWIALLIWTFARTFWTAKNTLRFALFLGLFGWFVQGLDEFGLYIPALAWTAFSIAGALLVFRVDGPTSNNGHLCNEPRYTGRHKS